MNMWAAALLGLATLLVVTFAVSACDGGEAANVDGKIVFTPSRDGNWEIYVMNADGSDQTRVTNNPAWDGGPLWSPDGTRIAFGSARVAEGELYVMLADGSSLTKLANESVFSPPAWSPDGSRLAYVSRLGIGDSEKLDIFVADADGSGSTNLTRHPGHDREPAWSPDGTRLVFVSARDDDAEIYVMNADGSGLTRLTRGVYGKVFRPSWSPDGARIAFEAQDGESVAIYVMNADGSGLTRLTDNFNDDFNPVWSPAP